MYYIYCDNHLIYDPQNEELAVINPILDVGLNQTSTLTFDMPSNHPYYDALKYMKSRIKLYQNEALIFEGRIISSKANIYNTKEFECEGGMAFFYDSVWRNNSSIVNKQVSECFALIISAHNQQVSECQFEVGTVTVSASDIELSAILPEYATVREVLKYLVENLGGYVLIRYEGDRRIIDYLTEPTHQNSQTVDFGNNLIDFSRNIDMTKIATAVIPLGAVIEKTDGKSERLTIESANNGVDYIYSQEAVNTFGWIFRTVIWDNAITAQHLKSKGVQWLSDTQWDDMTIELKAFDLHYTDSTIEQFKIGDKIHVVSKPHGLDRWFLLSKMTVYLCKPQENVIVLGESSKPLTAENQNINLEVEKTNKQAEKLSSKIEQTAESITAEVTRATGAEQSLSSQISLTAEGLTTLVTQKVAAEKTRAETAESGLSDDIAELDTTLTSKIEQTAESITAEVTRATGAENALSSKVEQTAASIKLSVTSTASNNQTNNTIKLTGTGINQSVSLSGTTATQAKSIADNAVKGITLSVSESTANNQTTATLALKSGNVTIDTANIVGTTATQAASIAADAVNGITLSVSNSETAATSTITLKNGNTTITSGTIELKGLVTFSDLKTKNKTEINGDNITTGTISADRIDVSKLYIDKIYTRGTLRKTAIDAKSYDILTVGSGTENYNDNINNVYVIGKTKVVIGQYFSSGYQNYHLLFDTVNHVVRPSYNNSTSYDWDLGNSNYPFGKLYVKTAQLGNSNQGAVGFFGTTPHTRQSLSTISTSSSLTQCINQLNSLITVLKNYGLIS